MPKEGDPWEEDYLIKNRPALIPTKAFRQDMRRLLEALVLFAKHPQAAGLQVRVGRGGVGWGEVSWGGAWVLRGAPGSLTVNGWAW